MGKTLAKQEHAKATLVDGRTSAKDMGGPESSKARDRKLSETDYSKYDFSYSTKNYEVIFDKGLSEEVVGKISEMKNEPPWMLEFRLRALKAFYEKPMPEWGADLSPINFGEIIYYMKASQASRKKWEDVPVEVKNTFDRLGIPEAERKFLAGVEAQYDCLTADTTVFTNPKGPTKIVDIKPGDKVFSWNKENNQIEAVRVKNVWCAGKKPVFEVGISNRTIRASDNHPFLSLSYSKRQGKRKGTYALGWIALKDLKKGSLVAIAKNYADTGSTAKLKHPAIEYSAAGRNQFGAKYSLDISGRYNKVTLPTESNSQLMWLFGFFFGDGYIRQNKKTKRVCFAVPENQTELTQELAKTLKQEFGYDLASRYKYYVSVNSTIIAKFFEENGICGKAKTKQVPQWIFSLPKTQILSFLAGFMDADGGVRDSKQSHDVTLTSANKNLLESMKSLAIYCGIETSKIWDFTHNTGGKMFTAYRISLSGNTAQLPSKHPLKAERLGKKKYYHTNKSARGEGGYFEKYCSDYVGFARVNHIVPAGKEMTYDIEVEGAHNFVANGLIVHNSEVMYSNIRKDLEQKGVVFLSMDEGLKRYPEIVKEHFSKVIPLNDNKFASLNSAVWSGGSFVYVPKNVKVDIPLQAYFRINSESFGQFERTLIIADEGAMVHYVEGCFTAGTEIRTESGTKPIELVEKGEKVLTHKGQYKEVYFTQARPYSGKLCSISVRGDTTGNLEATEEHPILVAKRERANERNRGFEPKWVEAKNAKAGDYVCYPINRKIISNPYHEFEIAAGNNKGQFTMVKEAVKANKDFFKLAGYFLSEGSTNRGYYTHVSFNINEKGYIGETKELFAKVFGTEKFYEPVHRKNNGLSIVVSSAKISRIFEYFGGKSDSKEIPEWMMLESPEKQAELIKGMFNGDGSYMKQKYGYGTKEMFRINTTSEKLAKQIREILLRLGVASSINKQLREAPRKTMYVIVVGGEYLKKFGGIVGIPAEAKMNGRKRATFFAIAEDCMYAPIKSVKMREVAEMPVYNFGVREDESYTANGLAAHNCTAPKFSSQSLHSAVVEVIAKEGAHVRYTTIQNWANNIYNLVTKRAFAYKDATVEWVDGNLGCLSGDTKVLTNNDVKNISEVNEGDYVYSLTPEFRTVRQKVAGKKANPPSEVFELTTENQRKVKATANHPFLVMRKKGKLHNVAWMPLELVSEGDMVAIAGTVPDNGTPHNLPKSELAGNKKISFPGESTEDLMWLLGFYMGDGYKDRGRVYFAVPEKDKSHIKVRTLMKSVFNLEMEKRGVVLRTASVDLARWLSELGFSGRAKEKRIPQWVFRLPANQKLEFIHGYVDADGHLRKNHKNMSISSANKNLLEDTKHLAISCGLNPTKISEWTRHDKLKLAKEAKTYTNYFLYFGEGKLENPVYFTRVSKIEPAGKEVTYDIEVEGTRNFIANGIFVHNSKVTMKYPAIYLMGEGAKGEVLSVALAGKGQHQDAGAKVVHLASNTTSKVTSKSISKDGGRASYRGLVKVMRGCKGVKSSVMCDALILDKDSRTDTYPSVEVDEPTATIAHEARVGKIGEDQVFYLTSRGLNEAEALAMIVLGFMQPFTKTLPLEYAVELNRLIEMEMENSVG